MQRLSNKPINTLEDLLKLAGVRHEDFVASPSRNLIKLFPYRTRVTSALLQQIWTELSLCEDIQSSFVRDMPLTEFKKFLLTEEYKNCKNVSLCLVVIRRASEQISAVSTKLKIIEFSSELLSSKGSSAAYYALMAAKTLKRQGLHAPNTLESCVKGTRYHFDFLNA